ncbi:hypothetical protein BJ742DRAFT_58122 [Cladochytrium replicatum]|nr:hypothetical protein BJ742DRAFT_58122 [Cladochytrium replicatum]
MCVISRSRSVVGHHYSLIVDGNLHQHHLLPPRLSLPLSSHLDPEAFAVLSKLLHVHSTISSDHIDVACIPGVPYNATLGYQAVRVRLSVEPSARWRLEALADMFCDVRAHFVHRVSIKGGKYASDFATKDVTARCSLRPLATGETSMLMVDMNLELKRWDCGPQRVSGPFCVIDHPEDEGRALCIPSHVPMEISQFSSPHDSLIFRGPAPVPSVPSPPPPLHPSGDESDAESTGPPSPSAAHDIPATDNPNLEPTRPARRARYLVASEWFVVVKVAIVDDKGGAMNMLRAAVGQKKALAEEDVTLEIPFSCSVRRHTISDDDLPSYMA